MNRETGAWLAVALLSVSALGVSATTLESATSTDANDVIELDYEQVPIGQDTASNVLDEIEDRGQDESESRPKTDPQAAGDASSFQSADGANGEASGAPDRQRRQSRSQSQRQQQRNQDDSGGDSLSSEPPSLLDRLLALLTALLPYLLALAVVATVVGLAVHYRERLLALFEDPEADDAVESVSTDSAQLLRKSPAHTVEGAWLGMVRRLDLDDPGTMTTSECASAAIEAGLDREAVQRLTETYEEVRYGGRPVTEDREEVARQSRRRIDAGGGA